MYSVCYLFILFLIYSFIGYICEITFCSIDNKKLVLNRGFLMGPYLPIYGFSCLLMSFCLQKYNDDIVALFVMSVVLCSLMEFFTSLILEKIFNVRWWDYSSHKFNLDGRVCLLNSCLFGVGGVILVKYVNQVIFKLKDVSSTIIIILGTVLMICFLTDLVFSIVTLCKIKITTNQYSDHDATREIKKLVEKEIIQDSFLMARLLNAFPRITGVNKVVITTIKDRINNIRNIKKNRRSHD